MANPKTGEDVRKQEKERLRALRVQGYNLIIPQTYSYCANKSLQTCGALTSSK